MSYDRPHRRLHLPSRTHLPSPRRAERRRLAVALLIVFTWVTPLPGQLEPRGPDFQINSYTPGDQDVSRVAVGSDGSMVLVWQSYPSILDLFRGIEGRFYDDGAAPLGTDLQVNTYTTSSQFLPNVSIAEITGDVVVVWTSVGSSGRIEWLRLPLPERAGQDLRLVPLCWRLRVGRHLGLTAASP